MTTLGRFSVLWLGLAASNALAGSCFCDIDLYPKVLLGKATPQDLAQCEQRPSRSDALGCMRALSFKNVQKGDQTAESFRLGVEALVAATKDKALSKDATSLLLTSQSYRDPELRAKVRPAMERAGRAPLWDTLVKASSGDAAGFTQALYSYCEQYPIISALELDNVSLAQLWPPPSGVKPADARKRFSCPYGQNLVLDAAIRALSGDLPAEPLALLSPQQLRILRNAVYARHGRTFQAKDLQDFFSQEPWYRKDPAYTDAVLTPQDQRNLEVIQAAESRAKK
ncbi:YARHG domain-containing protein [Hyalangium gracile]|uniref:YARHG domain-containing protein n=1 Tax=Hyalangium gracile TaxID=394092 RepID=UPI001CCE2EEE|nr:YARHG domain-containing protein [Hyalangium gracile]